MGLRAWICVLAATAFAAGLAGGLYAGELRAAAVPPGSHSQAYRHMFEQTFELTPERRRLFEELLERYDADVEEVRQRALAASISGVQPELAALGVRYRDAIRNHVLPDDQQEHFDRLVAQTFPPPARP
jgi:FPC/CPF motif-containing protein YcgG